MTVIVCVCGVVWVYEQQTNLNSN